MLSLWENPMEKYLLYTKQNAENNAVWIICHIWSKKKKSLEKYGIMIWIPKSLTFRHGFVKPAAKVWLFSIWFETLYVLCCYLYLYVHLCYCIFDTEPRTVQQANCFLCVLVTASEPYLAYLLYAELFTSSTN